jgi:transient receptor potential cation channel subfamily M protein 3
MPPEIQEQLIRTIMKTFGYTNRQANNLFRELMMCVKRRDLVKFIVL